MQGEKSRTNYVDGLPSVPCIQLIEAPTQLDNLLRVNRDIARLTLMSATQKQAVSRVTAGTSCSLHMPVHSGPNSAWQTQGQTYNSDPKNRT